MTKARDLANASTALSAVSATELGYVDGVTSAIQTQIDGKQAINANVSTTELGYLDGVTSAIQTQLDAKIAKTLTTTTGDIIYASGANTPARLGIGSSAQVLTVSGGIPAWATPAGGNTGPSFSAYLSSGQSVTNGTFTKVQANTEDWDTNSNYDTTNYRFTPTTAGYYVVSVNGYFSLGTPDDAAILYLYKNGSGYKITAGTMKPPGGNSAYYGGSSQVYLNGSTDYIEMYVYFSNATRTVPSGSTNFQFAASKVRD
jgi:hypothetical protein